MDRIENTEYTDALGVTFETTLIDKQKSKYTYK